MLNLTGYCTRFWWRRLYASGEARQSMRLWPHLMHWSTNALRPSLTSNAPTSATLVPPSISDVVAALDTAFDAIRGNRQSWPPNTDIWALSHTWAREKRQIADALRQGTYRLSPQTTVERRDGETCHIWSARDAVVLKAIALVLADRLPAARSCTHVKGHGGLKRAVRDAAKAAPNHRLFAAPMSNPTMPRLIMRG